MVEQVKRMARKNDSGVVDLVDGLIRDAIVARASDVHFEPTDDGLRVRFRIDAQLTDVRRLPSAITANVVARLKVLAGLLTYRTDTPQEGSIAPSIASFPCDIRVATFPTIRGERVVLRLMNEAAHGVMTLDALGHAPTLTERLGHLALRSHGLLLVCGPAGSGKTTTLYALLDHILRQRPELSILAVEDPVEIRYGGITQIKIEPDRGLTYPVALRSLLRQDPQVLMVGEIRDAQTAHIVVEAALTGHLLLSTLHSGTPAEAIVRLREMGVEAYQLTSILQAVVAQRLVRTVCQTCGPDTPRSACPRCLGTGYAGRAAIAQCVEMSPALRAAIMSGQDLTGLAQPTICAGSLRADAQRLLDAGRTTAAEIERVLGN